MYDTYTEQIHVYSLFSILISPKTYDQLDVPKDLFGEAAVYLKGLVLNILLCTFSCSFKLELAGFLLVMLMPLCRRGEDSTCIL